MGLGKNDTATLHDLERSEKLRDLLKQDRKSVDDCTSCRVVGGSAFLGLAAYTLYSGHAQLKRQEKTILASKSVFGMRSRQVSVVAISFGLAWMGVYRLFG